MAPRRASEPFHIMDFKSRRSPVLGRRGMVASSQPLASEVGPATVSLTPYKASAQVYF